ncbi:lytic transglycosylase domain-containing protein [Flaviflagellibacter deserti]|uniref:Lytic transglycosylase domain-containing protein n=1 Tax=Flaviflagellibacter deserti TaxID=2267266 RepID=A0ABV9Z5Y5_9HYPH
MINRLLTGAALTCSLFLAHSAAADDRFDFIQQQREKLEASAASKTQAKRSFDENDRDGKDSRKPARKLIEGRASTSTEPAAAPGGRGNLHSLVQRYAQENGVPYDLAHGVVMVESRYNAKATGRGGYIGLMQLSYRTAQGMGYSGSRAALYDPETNLRYGMRYLGEAYRKAGGSMCGAVSKYQGGHGVRGVTRAGSAYCGKVKNFIARGVPKGGTQVADASQAKS